ncbi:hypothetical protein OG689_34990 [Kitasatospora sp. NBC_00240]|uniref:hypothetical protein n=1 Tax=Kitasatospora sp. NBC_00240 TaxID=2903567 RepID=UPI0022532677|nr:hypothetical protein [Kitasatospora sp. NBC_00240]MCX5214409.1 hypothetical protein [Kitasatospora sp. NBC_00240]
MCRRATCRTCKKITYAGCGMHVDQVLTGVPAADRCGCERNGKAGGFSLRKLFGRG